MNKKIYRILIYVAFCFYLLTMGCATTENGHYVRIKTEKIDLVTEKNPLWFLHQTDTLTLNAHFSECGEFGGHKETFYIYRKYYREYFTHYIRDSIDLTCPVDFEENAVIVKDTVFKLSAKNERQILKYLNKLFKRGLTPKYPSHSNDYFSAKTKYGLFLSTDEPDEDWHEFRKLQEKLIK